MCVFNEKDLARYTLIMAHLEWLYANGWISDEDYNMLEEVYAQKYHISENSVFSFKHKNKANIV